MYHQHFKTIDSTQVYLKENLERLKLNEFDILISCSEQTAGIGRKGNTWDSYPNSLAMSFTLRPNLTPTLTPIEVGLIVIKFIQKKFKKELFLKWPNDLLTSEGKKCGGILCQYMDSSTVIVGLGLNLGKLDLSHHPEYSHGLGNVDEGLLLQPKEQEQISKELYQEFLIFRYRDSSTLIKDFTLHCYHINKEVLISEDGKDFIGIFKGIGENGEAKVEIDSKIHFFMSSSLSVMS